MTNRKNRYTKLIEDIFDQNYREDAEEVAFKRDDLVKTAEKFGIKLPKNLGDVVYSFRYRANLPASIRQRAPAGLEWVIRPMGQANYQFSLASMPRIIPNSLLVETKIPDATPGIIARYAFNVAISDEKHYRLVPPEQLTDEDLANYRDRVKSPQRSE
ncbi:MAG: hypothetical protein F9K25_13450 [Candidatus Contendobacter sp.]|nr:MAG: hypothetical protein F9K25_13450 [Candidatus Contendobacter sp.]